MRRTQFNFGKPSTNFQAHLKSSGELDLSALMTLDFARVKISRDKIPGATSKTRDKHDEALKVVVDNFNKMVNQYRELPADESFSRVISALRKLNKIEKALQLFDLISEKLKSCPETKEKIIGAYTSTAILQIFRDQINQANNEDEKQVVVNKAEALWSECQIKNYIDTYILTDMMCIYSSIGDYQKAIDLFSNYKESADLPMYSQYIISLIKLGKAELALQALNQMKEFYKKLTDKKSQDDNAMYSVYDVLIIHYFDQRNDQIKAIELFDDATKDGFYPNNRLTIDEKDQTVRLDFHWDKNYKEKEGGLPLTVAKVAFLFFMHQVAKQEIHFPAEIVTGGHIEKHSKLKQEFPDYLHKEYGVEVKWHQNPKILEFTIPYSALRKIRLIQDMLAYIDSHREDFDDDNHIFQELTRRYRADLRRDNEKRVNKVFSEIPSIPAEFEGQALTLAKAGMEYYEKRNYGQAENCYQKLIQLKLNHPWPCVQLGWILHRSERLDEAIDEYQKAIALFQSENIKDPEFLSEIYRKMGWAYDRKHRSSSSLSDLDKTFECYQQAVELNPNNFEVYNNWGIGLLRTKKFADAIKKFEIVKDKKPKHDEVCVQLGICYKQLKQYELSEKFYREAIARSEKHHKGTSAAWAYYELGELYYLQYKSYPSKEEYFEASHKAFDECLRLQPTRDQAYHGLANLYELKEDTEKSSEYRQKANNLSPKKETIATFAQITKTIQDNVSSLDVQSKEKTSEKLAYPEADKQIYFSKSRKYNSLYEEKKPDNSMDYPKKFGHK